ncbi:Histone H3, partial [Giardia duodenalis]
VPVLHEDPLRRGRPDARSTDTGCRALLSGATGIEKDIPLSARRANVLRGGCLPTQRGSGGAAFTTPLSGLQPLLRGGAAP